MRSWFAEVDSRMRGSATAALLAATAVAWAMPGLGAPSARHVMDSLSAEEYRAAVKTLKEESFVSEAGLYPLITLEEPGKTEVLKWKSGESLPRQAFAIVKRGPRIFEAVVDIGKKKVVTWREIEDSQPSILLSEEWSYASRVVMANRDWRAAVRRRGIEDLSRVVCVPLTAGYFGIAEEEGRRLVKVTCFDSEGVKNYWGRPIEGLTAVVDQNEGRVMQIIDTGVLPIPGSPVDIGEDSVGKLREPPNPISLVQTRGPSFEVDGHLVRWQKWRFHFRIDPRAGLVVSLVRYDDGGRLRSILYQGSLSELFVPYMDPAMGWYFRAYMDAGELGVGKLASRLEPGLDCPTNAMFFDTVFADDWGEPYRKERAACLFERYAGDIAWRHDEAANGTSEVRKRVDLVLRLVSAVGNYDYVFDWVFQQDGTIRVAVAASGVEQVKAVQSRTVADDKDGRDTAFGRMVSEHTVAVNHDHFFSFRLDMDVDGPENSFLVERLIQKELAGESPRKSIWVVDSQTTGTELAARLRINLEKPALWRIINPGVHGPLGYPVSYQLKPHMNAVSLLSPDDFPQRRAGFTDFHLWVTPYRPGERYAAGTYPNQSKGGGGLPTWTRKDRPVERTDIVLWYTLGFHHVVRAEDWPVLPTSSHEFELRPFDFFERNPALDLPEP